MELSFVIKALQRRWWVIVLFSLLGAIPGSLLDRGDQQEFQSDAVLLVSPPTTSQTNAFFGDPDRYVQSQLNVLRSLSLASRVAEQLGAEPDSGIARFTTFRQINDTDVVIVSTTHAEGELAKSITQAFVDTYIASQRESAQAVQADDIEAFNSRIAAIEEELAAANEAIAEAARPYLSFGDGAVPNIDVIAPADAANRQLLIDELNLVQTAKNDFELLARLRVNTEIVQNASDPFPVESSSSVLIIGGYLFGAMLGVVVALVWAQFSPYLIDEVSVSEVTGQPVVGTLTRSRTLRNNPLLASQQGRGRVPQTLAQLAVRSEALGSVSRPLVIACIAPRPGAGATTTSLALAGRFAQQGSLVIVLDADDRDRSLSRRHPSPGIGGLAELVDCVEREADCEADRVLTPTELGGVNVIAQGEEHSVLRRANANAVVRTAALFGDVLIIDGGPLLGSAAVIEICRHADAIVLAVPLQKQHRGQVADVVQQLGADRSKLLTVVNEPVSQGFLRRLVRST